MAELQGRLTPDEIAAKYDIDGEMDGVGGNLWAAEAMAGLSNE